MSNRVGSRRVFLFLFVLYPSFSFPIWARVRIVFLLRSVEGINFRNCERDCRFFFLLAEGYCTKGLTEPVIPGIMWTSLIYTYVASLEPAHASEEEYAEELTGAKV